jgi:AcrR family transcriptional regulator
VVTRVRRQDPATRREEILQTAVAEIERRGFQNTRVADVAGVLGVSPALVFYHFTNKERLVAAAFEYAAERDLGRLDRAVNSGRSARERLGAVLKLYSPTGSSSPGWTLWIEAWAAALRTPELRAVSRRLDLRWKDAVEAVIVDGVASGEFSCADPHAAAWRITALLDGLAVQVTVHKGLLTRTQMAQWVRDQAVRELSLAPGALG